MQSSRYSSTQNSYDSDFEAENNEDGDVDSSGSAVQRDGGVIAEQTTSKHDAGEEIDPAGMSLGQYLTIQQDL